MDFAKPLILLSGISKIRDLSNPDFAKSRIFLLPVLRQKHVSDPDTHNIAAVKLRILEY
jgi:hypothetical protein